MKRVLSVVLLFLVAASGSALAGQGKAKVELKMAAQVGDVTLAPGRYEVTWDGEGRLVQVSFRQGNDVVASVEGSLEELGYKASRNQQVLAPHEDGVAELRELLFRNRTESLSFRDSQVREARAEQGSLPLKTSSK